jgi:hypothetical protein
MQAKNEKSDGRIDGDHVSWRRDAITAGQMESAVQSQQPLMRLRKRVEQTGSLNRRFDRHPALSPQYRAVQASTDCCWSSVTRVIVAQADRTISLFNHCRSPRSWFDRLKVGRDRDRQSSARARPSVVRSDITGSGEGTIPISSGFSNCTGAELPIGLGNEVFFSIAAAPESMAGGHFADEGETGPIRLSMLSRATLPILKYSYH